MICVIASTVALVGATSVLQTPVRPALNPETDKGWSKDYPIDGQPVAKRAFSYPYPIVQDSGDFDKDYVKDENADGGEWKAQFDFDKLRTGIDAQRDSNATAGKALTEAEKRLEEAKKALAAAQSNSETSEEDAKAASQEADEADKKVKDLIGDAAGNGTGGANGDGMYGEGGNGTGGANGDGTGVNGSAVGGKVGEGVHEVERSVTGLKDCQEQLAKARSDLEKALADKKKREEEAKAKAKKDAEDARKAKKDKEDKDFDDEKSKNVNEKQHNLDDANKESAAADMDEAELAKAKDLAAEAAARVAELEKRLAEEEANAAKAEADYDKQTKDEEQTEAELAAAAEKLRNLRATSAGSTGGVIKTPPKGPTKSAASSTALSGVILACLCAALLQ